MANTCISNIRLKGLGSFSRLLIYVKTHNHMQHRAAMRITVGSKNVYIFGVSFLCGRRYNNMLKTNIYNRRTNSLINREHFKQNIESSGVIANCN